GVGDELLQVGQAEPRLPEPQLGLQQVGEVVGGHGGVLAGVWEFTCLLFGRRVRGLRGRRRNCAPGHNCPRPAAAGGGRIGPGPAVGRPGPGWRRSPGREPAENVVPSRPRGSLVRAAEKRETGYTKPLTGEVKEVALMPATTGMKGAGYYDQHSTAQLS